MRAGSLFRIRGELSPGEDLLIGFAGLAAITVLWCVSTYGGYVKPLFLPTPSDIWRALVNFHERGWLVLAIWRSFSRVTEALVLVICTGIPLGVLMGAFPSVDAFLRKIVDGAKSVPTTGIVGLIILWFSIEERAKIVFLFLGAIFYMIILTKNAIMSVSEDYVRVALDVGANRRQMLIHVLTPGALPQIWDAIAVCNGIMWTYIVLAEFINSDQEQLGLGYLLFIGSRSQESGQVFAALLIIALLSSLTDWAFHKIRSSFLNW